ncbi:MAG: ATP-dependent zinc metalloprotease FtsH [Succinivibrio sp.]|nr:ATP-dependent zinc metalloprotease FtsH [Succinivibrio sp.]MCI5639241.1 ATP-dependent zinc metalloprotease FtsH [Succinivibrio sp.]MDD6068190.1 ATP-dependent zinc metalloprotease FtsH [Succinivibrio sp.]MDY5733909.1 ATP-dependent zinc metalloprotease FtsH [Succinivibrio sp.]MDY5904624.1 ATP-dependent zinc metalloprotease FtsH [Succinivibrio sp.]
MAKNLILWLVIAVILMTLFESFTSSDSQGRMEDYTTFVREVQSDQVQEVVFDGKVINGLKKSGERFVTVMPLADTAIIDTLLTHNVRASGTKPEEPSTLLSILVSWFPMLLLIAIWLFYMRQMQGGGKGNPLSFGKSKAKLLSENQIKTTFADVAGCDEAKEDVVELVDFLKDPTKYSKLGGRIPRGVLMVGPPGTGKTLLARAIAGEAKVPFFSISGSDFVEMFVGVGASRVRDMFAQAKKNAPCIIFIDEIDAVGRKRGIGMGGGHDEREQTLNQLLVEMDGFEGFEAVIVIAATNRPDVLDPALLRPGRFDRQVVVGLPDVRGREQILNVHVKKVPLGKDVDTATIARGTPGFSGAELANLVNEAALSAARHNKRVVNMEEFEQAKDKLLMGAERRSMAMNEHEKINTAYHEAGHAIVGKLVPEHDPVYKVSIIPRGRALGVTMYLPEQDKVSQSRQGLLSDISTLFAGRIAEELMFGTDAVTTGASNDIERATTIARNMITRWGFSKRLPPMQYEKDNDQSAYLGGGTTTMVSMSDKTALIIDEEVSEIINSCYKRAQDLLEANKDILESMKDALLKYETLDADQIDDLMNRREVRAPSYPKSNNDDNKDKSEDKKDPSAESKAKDESLTKDESDTKEANQNIDDNNKED